MNNNDRAKFIVRNFVNHNTYHKFKDVVGTRLVSNDELKLFAKQLHDELMVPELTRHVKEEAVHRAVVNYFLSEFGAQAMGAECKVNMHAHEVSEDAWKKYRPRRTRNKKQ